MEKYISKSAVAAELEKRKNQFVSQAESFRKIGKKEQESYFATLASNMNSLSRFIDTLEVNSTDAFIEKAWDWIEDNILSSNQQDKSRLYFEQFKNYMKGE